MAKSVVISNHAKIRAAERLDLTRRDDVNHLFRQAISYGINPSKFTGKFKDYLLSKLKKHSYCSIIVYSDFIYVRHNNKLITMYPVPDKYIPVKTYLKNNVNVIEEEVKAELIMLKEFKTSDFKFYTKKPGKNGKMYTAVLIVYNELVSVSTSKNEDKAKLSCVKQYKDETKKKREC